MTNFFEVFEPGLRHWREQKDLEKVLIVTNDEGGSGPQPLDLDSGSVVVKMPRRADEVTETVQPDEAEPEG